MTLFPNKLILQSASNMLFLKKKQNKTKQNDNEKKKKTHPAEVEPETFDMEGQRIIHSATQPLLRPNVKFIVYDIFVPTILIIQDGAENADVRRTEYHKRSPLSTTGIPRLCVAFS